MPFNIIFKQYGENAILIEWPKVISKEILNDIGDFSERIKQKNIKQIIDINFVYSSMLVLYDNLNIEFKQLKEELLKIYETVSIETKTSKILWKIPVCYDEIFGMDLHFISFEMQLDEEEIIALHSNAIYTVYGIGFLPGFLYLGGLNDKLNFPRRVQPRLVVPKGSIGIGGSQTGIYPQNSPGGWQIIGKTPISIFNINRKKPIEISTGDCIQFYPVSFNEFEIIEEKCKMGTFNLQKHFIND